MSNSRSVIVRQGFAAAGIPSDLVNEVLDTFEEAKRRYYRGDLRPSAVEGGRYSEAVFRVLQWASTGKYTPIGKTLPKVPDLLKTLESGAQGSESIRLHIPRTLRLIYDVRNKRDAAHLADGIDPNMQDATLVIRNMDWIMAELVREFHSLSPAQAQPLIDDLVSKEVPLIEEFDGFPRVLKKLQVSMHVLVLLYWRGAEGAELSELREWVRPTMRRNLRRTLSALDEKDQIHLSGSRYVLTRLGERDVEDSKVLDPL